MSVLRMLLFAVLLASASCVAADQVVWQEDFSGPFIERDWIYNNSGPNSETGYDGQPWVAKVSDDGNQILGYNPVRYFWTTFANYSLVDLPTEGWVGSGKIVTTSHYADSPSGRSLQLKGQTAYRNLTTSMEGARQWVQCYVRLDGPNSNAVVSIGDPDMTATAASIRLIFDPDPTQYRYILEALDGNGSGGGAWAPIGYCAVSGWFRVMFALDYATGSYSVNVHKAGVGSDLGFRDAVVGLGALQVEQPDNKQFFYVDDIWSGNSPYPSGPTDRAYWSDAYNHWSVSYGGECHDGYDIYPWMTYTNTAADKPAPYKAALPPGWTAAFDTWGDGDPYEYFGPQRGKMGFGRYIGPYGQSASNPCLNVWSSHGDMRVAGPALSGPGVYTLSWRIGVWNGNTADPAMQYKWTDWCDWGYGYTNWCTWDLDPITQPPYTGDQVNTVNISRFWNWKNDPFHKVDPDGRLGLRPNGPHPAGEEPGMWHSYSRSFTLGLAPVKDDGNYDLNQDPGYFVGFRVSHSHDPNDAAGSYWWATTVNIDDILLTKKDPVLARDAKKAPEGTYVEIQDLVITNMIPPDIYVRPWVDVFLETPDRSGAVMARAYDYDWLWDENAFPLPDFKLQIGQVVNLVGAVQHDEAGACFIGDNWDQSSRLPAIVPTGAADEEVKPVGIVGRDLAGSPTTSGLNTEGMLVTVFGRLNAPTYSPPVFYVDDGSALPTGTFGADGVRIDCSRLRDLYFWTTDLLPPNGTPVAVTGTLTLGFGDDYSTVNKVIFPVTPDDIRPL